MSVLGGPAQPVYLVDTPGVGGAAMPVYAINASRQSPDARYPSMPTQAALQASLDADAAASIARRHVLPAGTLAITGDLTIPAGATLVGQGQDGGLEGTVLSLAATGRVYLTREAGIERVHIAQHASASVDAVYATATSVDAAAHRIRIKEVRFSGGNAAVWCIHLQNPYEYHFDDVLAITSSNGIWIEATNDHLYNPGDAVAVGVRVRLQAASTTALRITGQKAYNTTGYHGGSARYPNNLTWVGFYATGGDNASWASSSMVGVEIINCPKIHFYGANLEQLSPAVRLSGQINTGSATYAIGFMDSWIGAAWEVNAGATDVQLLGSRVDLAPTGANIGRIQISGTDVSTGSSEPFFRSPHYRGNVANVQLPFEVLATNSSGSSISNNRICKWTATGVIAVMTSSDAIGLFAGVSIATISNAAAGYVAFGGIINVNISGAVSLGDYVGITGTAGQGVSLGADPGDNLWIGIAQQGSGSGGTLPVKLRIG